MSRFDRTYMISYYRSIVTIPDLVWFHTCNIQPPTTQYTQCGKLLKAFLQDCDFVSIDNSRLPAVIDGIQLHGWNRRWITA